MTISSNTLRVVFAIGAMVFATEGWQFFFTIVKLRYFFKKGRTSSSIISGIWQGPLIRYTLITEMKPTKKAEFGVCTANGE